jgi:transposase
MKPLVTDALWERVQPLLPPPPKRRFRFPGRKPLDSRKVLTGILFVLKTGIAWDDLPAELGFGCGKTCREQLKLWHETGVWAKLHAALLAELNGADRIDWRRALIDASFAKAPEGGEDTGPNPTDRGKSGSKHHVMTDAQGIPLAATVTAANVNEVTVGRLRAGHEPRSAVVGAKLIDHEDEADHGPPVRVTLEVHMKALSRRVCRRTGTDHRHETQRWASERETGLPHRLRDPLECGVRRSYV